MQLLGLGDLQGVSEGVQSALDAARQRIEGLETRTLQLVTELADNEAAYSLSKTETAKVKETWMDTTELQIEAMQVRLHAVATSPICCSC